MRSLVTGSCGFLGIHLCQRLLNRGDDVIGLDNFYSSNQEKLKYLSDHPKFKFVNQDVIESLNTLGSFDEIYHLACPASPPRYQKDGVYTAKVNFLGTLNACELAVKSKANLLFTSTSEIYGDPLEHPQKESYRGNVNSFGPRACYDEGKRLAETLCYEYKNNHGISVSVVRIFNTYGPYMDLNDGRVVTNFITQALSGNPLTVYGKGTQTRSLCYASDLIEGIIRAIKTHLPSPINLGNPEEYTVLELAKIIKELTSSHSQIEYKQLPIDDPSRRKPDITLAQSHLDWKPVIPLEEGLNKTIHWAKSTIH